MIRRSKRQKAPEEDSDPDVEEPKWQGRPKREPATPQLKQQNQSPLRRSGRARKVRHILMDDYDEDEEGSKADKRKKHNEVPLKVEAPEEVLVKEEVPEEVIATPTIPPMREEMLDEEINIKEESIQDPLGQAGSESGGSNRKPDPMEYILSECVEHVIDEVKLLIRYRSAQVPKIYLMCPVCNHIETLKSLGSHLYNQHQAGYLRCPGKKCQGERVKYSELHVHIQNWHFSIKCDMCMDQFDVRKVKFHQNICKGRASDSPGVTVAGATPGTTVAPTPSRIYKAPPPSVTPMPLHLQSKTDVAICKSSINPRAKLPILVPKPVAITLDKSSNSAVQNSNPVKQTPLILQPRSDPMLAINSSRPNVIILPQQNRQKPPINSDTDQVASILSASSRYEVHLGGKLVIIDDVHYYVKGDITFTDCPLCENRAMAVSVIGSHLITDHMLASVPCPAKDCSATVSSNVFQEHLIEKHGKIRCRACGFILGILNSKDHFDNVGECLKNPSASGVVGPVIVKNPGSGGRMINYDVNAMAPSNTTLVPSQPEGPMMDELSQRSIVRQDSSADKEDSQTPQTGGKIPTLPCPHCGKLCSYLKKHIRDVHQPKTNCPICGRRMGHSYLSEHLKIQHQGKEVPTKQCPLCMVVVQKLKNHLKATHKMTKSTADEIYEKYYPMSQKNSAISKTQTTVSELERQRKYARLSEEGLPVPETVMTVEERVLVFDD